MKSTTGIHQSPNYRDGAFQNLSPTDITLKNASFFKMLKGFINKPRNAFPPAKIPSVKTDLKDFQSDQPAITWFGHSSYLIQCKGKNILVDPVFSGNASPFSFMIKAFPGSNIYGVNDMPDIDMLIITHDHYDHLDKKTVRELVPKTKHIYTALGVGQTLEDWGIDHNKITEFDWWQGLEIEEGIELISTPARHFSGRTLKRNQSLWSAFVLKLFGCNIFIGSDSGYDTHFKSIGDKYGPFDIAILETGQYNEMWPLIHMMPEETVTAATELKAKLLMPVHWGKFALAFHPWTEPAERVIKAAAENKMLITTPMIGERFTIGAGYPTKQWWVDYTD